MLYSIHTRYVKGYNEGQAPIIYLASDIQTVHAAGNRFVFTDGHAIKGFTEFYDRLDQLSEVPWSSVNSRKWNDTLDYPDRKRQKQAEFLIYQQCDWGLIREIGVINQAVQQQVQSIIAEYPENLHRPVSIHRDWYYD